MPDGAWLLAFQVQRERLAAALHFRRQGADVTNGQDEFPQIGEDRRLDSLDERLERLEQNEATRTGAGRRQGQDQSERLGNRVLADLIGGIAGGALIGWVIDLALKTAPWGLIIMLFAGIAVAFRNVIRTANKISRDAQARAANDEGRG